jgi:hypothetical protein
MQLRLHTYAGVPGIAKADEGRDKPFISSSAELNEGKDEFSSRWLGAYSSSFVHFLCRVDNPLLRQPLE